LHASPLLAQTNLSIGATAYASTAHFKNVW